VTGTLRLSSGPAYSKQLQLALGPLQTDRIDIREALGGLADSDMGGLTLTFPNNEGISASQIVFDEVTGLAAIMKLFERDKDESAEAHVLRAPMIALRQPDAALAYPKDTVLNPRLFLRNAGQNKLQVTAAIHWRSQDGEGTYNYPALNLKSNEVSVLDLGLLQDNRAIPPNANWSNVTLSYTGKSADLVPVAVSYDSKTRYGLQSPFTEGTNRLFKGGMWHVDSTHGTLITTGNGGSEKTTAQVALFYNGGKSQYRIEKLLIPGQQLLLDVGQLIRNQIPDSDGNVIPPETMSGSYELRDLDHPAVGLLYEGKLTIDKTYGHASYGCGTCCGLYNTKLTPNPFDGPPSVYNQDEYLALEQCGGQWEDWTGTAYSWQSTNPAVATLPNSVLYTVAPGTATGNAQNLLQATHPAPRCPQTVMGGSQPVTVVSAVLSLHSSGTVSSDDAALANYQSAEGTTSLGNIIGSGQQRGCFIGSEMIGALTPATYSGNVILHRYILNGAYYKYSSLYPPGNISGKDDTSDSSFRDDNPQSGGSAGRIYDLDAPGLGPPDVNVYRVRLNFYAWAALPDGTRISPYLNYYVRLSCAWTGTQYVFNNDVTNDNQIGSGTTLTSWNLQ
jgi:hypothetical protein